MIRHPRLIRVSPHEVLKYPPHLGYSRATTSHRSNSFNLLSVTQSHHSSLRKIKTLKCRNINNIWLTSKSQNDPTRLPQSHCHRLKRSPQSLKTNVFRHKIHPQFDSYGPQTSTQTYMQVKKSMHIILDDYQSSRHGSLVHNLFPNKHPSSLMFENLKP